jgi:hypothetical protein
MNAIMLQAFRNELTKTAFMNTLKDVYNDAWGNQNWFGRGTQVNGGMNQAQKLWGRAKSLGGLTKVLPVGAKSMFVAGTAPMLYSALKKQDPSGMERSRAERFAGASGNIAGGVLGAGLLSRTGFGKKHPIASTIVGGIGGPILGDKALAAPIHNLTAKKEQQVPNGATI